MKSSPIKRGGAGRNPGTVAAIRSLLLGRSVAFRGLGDGAHGELGQNAPGGRAGDRICPDGERSFLILIFVF